MYSGDEEKVEKKSDVFHDIGVHIERKIREVCKGLFFEGKMKTFENRIDTHQIFLVLIAKMKEQNWQGEFLTKKRRHLSGDNIYEKDIEVLEELFHENGLYAYSFICCLLTVLKQRNAYGIQNIRKKYIQKVLDNYGEACRKKHREDFKKFSKYFKCMLWEAGKISLCCYIHVKMEFYISIYFKHSGQPVKACQAGVRYLNSRLQDGIYSNYEEIIAETIVFALFALSMNHLKQAQHMLNAATIMTQKLDEREYSKRFQRIVLQEFIYLGHALLLSKNLDLINRYQNKNLSVAEREILKPFDNYNKLVVDIENEVIDVAPLDANSDSKQRIKEKLEWFRNLLCDPIIKDFEVTIQQIYAASTANEQ